MLYMYPTVRIHIEIITICIPKAHTSGLTKPIRADFFRLHVCTCARQTNVIHTYVCAYVCTTTIAHRRQTNMIKLSGLQLTRHATSKKKNLFPGGAINLQILLRKARATSPSKARTLLTAVNFCDRLKFSENFSIKEKSLRSKASKSVR